MDNQIFKVNGRNKEDLEKALNLLCDLKGRPHVNPETPIKAWKIDTKHGFVIYWSGDEGTTPFPVPVSVETVVPMIWEWLQSNEAKAFVNDNTEEQKYDGGDVQNQRGWTLSVESWGHGGGSFYGIGAVRPSWCWYGK